MTDASQYAREFNKNCRSYYINAYPLTPDLIASMAQQSIILTQKLTQAASHIDALLAEIDRLNNRTNEESK